MDEHRVIGRIAFNAQTDDGTTLHCVVRAVDGVDGWTLHINDAAYAAPFPTIGETITAFASRAAVHGGVKTYSDFEIDVSGADDPAGEIAARDFVVQFLRCLGLRAYMEPAPRTLQ